MDDIRTVKLGLLGCGTVGGALARLLDDRRDMIVARTGVRLEITRIAVRDLDKPRDVAVADHVFTVDTMGVVEDPDVDVVVELIGGVDVARELVAAALALGKPVITGNKALLAAHGAELYAAADAAGVDLLFEAAVGGGIPVVRPLRESLQGEPILRVMGIVNGTTNYILTRMTEDDAEYADALAEAQRLGYAEADPTADVAGHDAAAKLAILSSIAFGSRVVLDDVHLEGIEGITVGDVDYARREGYVIKLLAVGERAGAEGPDGAVRRVAVRVHPALVPATHPLASVRDSFNAVFVEGSSVGEVMFYGRGAGGGPTASAVMGDLVDAAGNLRRGTSAALPPLTRASIVPIEELISQYYVAIEVVDRHGVLAAVAGAFAENDVSIRSVVQEGTEDQASLVFVTHAAREAHVQATLAALRDLDAVRRVGSVLRLIGGEA